MQGFTLIEILVASVILFSSIAAVTMIYRGAFISTEKANSHMIIAGVVPAVLIQVREQIRGMGNNTKTTLNGNGSSWGTEYQWEANQIAVKAAPPVFDMDSGDTITPAEKYKLWDVELNVSDRGLTLHYEFKELSWNEQ